LRLLLDSTVLIDVLRDRPVVERLRAHRRDGDVAGTTAINVDEVVRGLRDTELDAARSLFKWVIVVPLGYAEGWRAGRWRREFSSAGTTLSQPDCLLAAAALVSGARLVTGNPRHFPMPEIEVEHWPVGE
jgi:predicted nucleic acid-binding protein